MGRGSGHGFATWFVQCSRESSNAKGLGHLNRLCQGLSDVPSGGKAGRDHSRKLSC